MFGRTLATRPGHQSLYHPHLSRRHRQYQSRQENLSVPDDLATLLHKPAQLRGVVNAANAEQKGRLSEGDLFALDDFPHVAVGA